MPSRYGAVLDTCVLVPMPLCDALLRLAEQGLFRPYWSEETLVELAETLTAKLGVPSTHAERRVRTMREYFAAALVRNCTEVAPALPDPNDRHVLGAAIKSDAQVVVTLNVRHFPQPTCAKHDIEVATPDQFLVNQFDLNSRAVRNVFYQQVGGMVDPIQGMEETLDYLAELAPTFTQRIAHAIRADLGKYLAQHKTGPGESSDPDATMS